MIPKHFNINVSKINDIYIININSGDINLKTAHSKIGPGLTKALQYLETEYTVKIESDSLEVEINS